MLESMSSRQRMRQMWNELDSMNMLFKQAREKGGIAPYCDNIYRPPWMVDEVWLEYLAFARGDKVPNNLELIRALRGDNPSSRGYRWMFSNVSGVMCLTSYEKWCTLIRENTEDADLRLDEGL